MDVPGETRQEADVIVLGGGPAGLMAAGQAAATGAVTILLEKGPRPGRKLLATGGGRCNLTCDRDATRFVAACGPSARFLHNALARFDPQATWRFFEGLGVPLKREADGRCFPASDRAADVLAALVAFTRQRGVQVVCECEVRSVTAAEPSPGSPRLVVQTSRGAFSAPAVILATGGLSHPATGATGDGYRLAEATGHRIVPPRPSEVSLLAGPGWVHDLSGLGLADAGLRFTQGRRKAHFRGALVFTHFGLSGPAALDASREIGPWLDDGPVDLALDLVPDETEEALDATLAREFAARPKATLRSFLRLFAPERLATRAVWIALAGPDRPVAGLSAKTRRAAAHALKAVPIQVTGTRGFDEAVITRGGVDLRDVSPSTLESRVCPGLHFAGEVLDLDGPRGGYNLQIAWTTGWVAGRHAAEVARRARGAEG